MTEFYEKHSTNKCLHVIIQARKLACKGFRAQHFNRNGDLTKSYFVTILCYNIIKFPKNDI